MTTRSTLTATVVDSAPAQSIHNNRFVPVVPVDAIPSVPPGYTPTRFEQRRNILRRVGDTERAEVERGLEEANRNAGSFKADLGEFAPDPAPLPALLGRLRETEATVVRIRGLLQCMEELDEIALSDAIQFLEAAHKEYEHRKDRMPNLRERYHALEKVFETRKAAIAEGMARAKAMKKEPA